MEVEMKQVKGRLVPKLRFKEFEKDGEWEEKKLGDICEILNNRRQPISSNNREKGQYPYYGASGIVDYVKDYIFDERLVLVGEDGAKWGSNEKTAFIAEGKYWVNNHAHVLKPIQINDVLLINFLVMTDLKPFITGAAPPKLTLGKLKTISIPLPRNSQEQEEKSKLEQQKIADCLSSLDELIDAEDKKLESLRLHKKVLMQELFPAEGQTLPKLHFPEFGNSPEWKTKKLGQIGDILMCKRIFAQETNDKGGIPFYKIGTLGGKPDAFIAKELFEEYKSKYNYPKKDEVLITCSGTVGKCLAFDGNDSYYQDSNIVWIDNKSLEISNKFLLILLSNTDWTKLNSTTITRIYGSDLRELSFVFPADEKEQQHIADFLSSIDNLITTQTKKLDSLRLHKKGLMQQLFPNPDN